MNTMKDRKSLWLPMAVLAVVFLLALGGCARGANTGNTSGNQTTGQTPGSTSTTTSGGSSVSDELNRLQQIDQQNQNDNNSLNTDDQNANQSQGSDQNTQPTGSLNLNGAISVNTAVAPAAPVCTTVACVQKFGDVQIAARVVALDKLKLYAQGHKALTDTQRSTIVNDVNTNESGLKDLKTKLDGETDINAAKTDVQDIYTKYRIYAVVLPRDYGEILLFHEQNIITRMTDAEPTIADLIQKDQAAGHDVSKLNTLFQDYKNKVADATTNANAAQALIPSLTPANYPGTDQTLKTYHADLKTARLDLQGAANDLHQMYMILKADLGASLTPTPTSGS